MSPINLSVIQQNCFSRNESFKIDGSSETSCEMTDETNSVSIPFVLSC